MLGNDLAYLVRHIQSHRKMVGETKPWRPPFELLSRGVGTESRIHSQKPEEIFKQPIWLLPGLLVPVNSNILPWKTVEITLDLPLVQPYFEHRIVFRNRAFPVPKTPFDVFPESAAHQTNRHLVKVL